MTSSMTESNSPVGPTRAELLARAANLLPLLGRHAPTGELSRHASDEVIDALAGAGFFRMFTPARFGGYETSIRTALQVCETIGSADASSAWLVSIASIAASVVNQLNEQAQQDVYGAGPDVRIAGSNASALARRVPGGARITGRWPYASGSSHAMWAMVGGTVDDRVGPQPYYFLIPASEVRLEDTWHTVGMRATASNTWVAENVFVPTHRMVPMGALIAGRPLVHNSKRAPVPYASLATLFLLPAILGAGSAAFDLTVDGASSKPRAYTTFERQNESTAVQLQISEAQLMLRTAQLHAYAVADDLDRAADRGALPDYANRARCKAMCSYASRQVIGAIDILLNVHGAGSFAEASPLQRYWRDANTAARHAGLNFAVATEVHGKSLLGVEEIITPMV